VHSSHLTEIYSTLTPHPKRESTDTANTDERRRQPRAEIQKRRDYQTFMSDTATQPPPAKTPADAPARAVDPARRWELPRVAAPLAPADVIAALDRAARRGELPGFEPSGETAFAVDVFGSPFDRELEGRVAPSGEGAEIAFRPRLLAKAPLVLLASVVLTLWPGIIFVDILVPASWWPTWTWYVPLVVLPTLFMAPGMWRKSETAAAAHAREQIGKIAVATGGDVVDEPR